MASTAVPVPSHIPVLTKEVMKDCNYMLPGRT